MEPPSDGVGTSPRVSEVPRHWIVVGHASHRRVTSFVDAVHREGAGDVTVVPWARVVDDVNWYTTLPERPTFLRIESTGEDEATQRAMLALGGHPVADLPFGAFVPPGPSHRGFLILLDRIEAALQARPQWTPLATPEGIRLVFDKRSFHEACETWGVSVPPSLSANSRADLDLRMAERDWDAVFVKIRTGSSAVGLGRYTRLPRPTFLTTVAVTRDGWFNSRKLHRYTAPAALDRVVNELMSHGVHIERAIAKAQLDGANFDCRALWVGDAVPFVVVRQNHHPITNLHLGGWRGDLSAFLARCPARTWQAALADVTRIAENYGGLHLGCDVMFTEDFSQHYIVEANAFGDLLPRLEREGRDVYATEVASAPAWFRSRG